MVDLKDDNIIFSKYLDTDIDSVCVYFLRSNESAFVDEYDIPEEYKYIVFVGVRENETFPDYIEIANYKELKEIINKDKNCLPDIQFNYKDDKNISLIDFFRKYILSL